MEENVVLAKEEKIKKRLKSFSIVLEVMELMTIIYIIGFFIMGIVAIKNQDGHELSEFQVEYDEIESNQYSNEIKIENNREWIKKELIDTLGETIVHNCGITIGFIIVNIIHIVLILLLDNLSKLFAEISKNGRPFSEKTVKYIKRVEISAILLMLLKTHNGAWGIELIIIFVLIAIAYIFEYGYKLQIESDETL